MCWSGLMSGSTLLPQLDRKSTRLNSSHGYISYAVFCLKKKKKKITFTLTKPNTHRTRTSILRIAHCAVHTVTNQHRLFPTHKLAHIAYPKTQLRINTTL